MTAVPLNNKTATTTTTTTAGLAGISAVNRFENVQTLVFGFIRPIQMALRSMHIIMPVAIIRLCVTYYYHRDFCLLVLTGTDNEDMSSYSLQSVNMKTAENVEFLVYGLNPDTDSDNTDRNTDANALYPGLKLMTTDAHWDTAGCGIATVADIRLSDFLTPPLLSKYAHTIQQLFVPVPVPADSASASAWASSSTKMNSLFFNGVFKCGGGYMHPDAHVTDASGSGVMTSAQCTLIIWDPNPKQEHLATRTRNALWIDLPEMPTAPSHGCQAAYSEEYGLYVLCHQAHAEHWDIVRIVFPGTIRKTTSCSPSSVLEWTPLPQNIPRRIAGTGFYSPSVVMFDGGRKMLMLCQKGNKPVVFSDRIRNGNGNDNNNNNGSFILDLVLAQMKDAKHNDDANNVDHEMANAVTTVPESHFSKVRCGVCVDEVANIVYTCHGSDVEYLDLADNTWTTLPATKHRHSTRPCLWMDNQMLFVAGNGNGQFADQLEFLDLRTSSTASSSWVTVNNAVDFKFPDNMAIERLFCSP